MKRSIILTTLLAVVCLGFAGLAQANDIQIVCTGSTTCTAGGVQTTGSSDPSFVVNISGKAATGQLWIAIAEPVASGANFTSANSSMWTALGLTGGQDHNFSSTVSNDGGFFVAGDSGFAVTTFNTGQTLGGKSVSGSITLPSGSYPAGTIFVAFTTDSNGGIIINSPWSESLLVTASPVPEPASLLLLGLGLAGVPFLRRRRS